MKESPVEKKPQDPELMGDQGSKRGLIESMADILARGGCKVANTVHENGHEWHPILPSHGEQKCIKCRCKVSNSSLEISSKIDRIPNSSISNANFVYFMQDSNIKCDRKRCVRSACNKSAARNRLNALTPGQHHEMSSTNTDDCCSAQCRARRHQKQKQRTHRDKNDRQHKTSGVPKS